MTKGHGVRAGVTGCGRLHLLSVLQVLLLLPALYLLVQTFVTVCQQRCHFLSCPGNWLQMLCALLSFSCIGLYIACVVEATQTLNRFSVRWASFTNFERAVQLHEVLRLLHACLLFLLFIKVHTACTVHHFLHFGSFGS